MKRREPYEEETLLPSSITPLLKLPIKICFSFFHSQRIVSENEKQRQQQQKWQHSSHWWRLRRLHSQQYMVFIAELQWRYSAWKSHTELFKERTQRALPSYGKVAADQKLDYCNTGSCEANVSEICKVWYACRGLEHLQVYPWTWIHAYVALSYGLGYGSNNVVEVKVVLLLVDLVVERGCRDLQIFGDSQLVINWILRAE